MALAEVGQKENGHHSIHLVAGLLVVDILALLVLHHPVEHQIVRIHHLRLDHRHLPIELVVCDLEGEHCILV